MSSCYESQTSHFLSILGSNFGNYTSCPIVLSTVEEIFFMFQTILKKIVEVDFDPVNQFLMSRHWYFYWFTSYCGKIDLEIFWATKFQSWKIISFEPVFQFSSSLIFPVAPTFFFSGKNPHLRGSRSFSWTKPKVHGCITNSKFCYTFGLIPLINIWSL